MRANGLWVAHIKQIARRIIIIVKRAATIGPAQNDSQRHIALRCRRSGNINQSRWNKTAIEQNRAAIRQKKRYQHMVTGPVPTIETARFVFNLGKPEHRLIAEAAFQNGRMKIMGRLL